MLVELSWPGKETFGEIIENYGHIPLPPYIDRPDENIDRDRYQTVYSKYSGAVAAPTAGLHFNSELLDQLQQSGIRTSYVTLHVSSGTFLPVQHQNVAEHPMHYEQISVSKSTIQLLYEHQEKIVSVGTTSLRTLESLFWYGCLLKKEGKSVPFTITKNTTGEFKEKDILSLRESLACILEEMDKKKMEELRGNTGIYILPGYTFRVVDGLLTNFHLPKSTLIMLVSAFVGDQWKDIYQSALENNYRFLSYGDTSLLWKNDAK